MKHESYATVTRQAGMREINVVSFHPDYKNNTVYSPPKYIYQVVFGQDHPLMHKPHKKLDLQYHLNFLDVQGPRD